MRVKPQRRRVVLRLVVSAGLVSACASGPPGAHAPPTDIAPQPQTELAQQIQRAELAGGYGALLELVLECHNVDAENDGVAERDTPVLEDD